MKCPPEIELNEFAEDRLESRRRWEIQEHLDQCTDCRTDLEGLQWVGGPLALLDVLAEAEGMDHPSDADLAALAEGSVDADRKAELLSHLGVCAECARLFGALPRPQRKLVAHRNLYGFAAAAALLLCLGLFAFTGKFADHKQAGTPVAQAGSGLAKPQQFAAKPPASKPQQPASKPTTVAAVKPTAPAKLPEPTKRTAAAKPLAKPVAPAKVSTPIPPPTVVAQAVPKITTRAVAPVRRLAARPHGSGHIASAVRARRTRSSRTGRSGYNNTQIAMATPQEVSRASRSEATTTRDAVSGTHDKALATSPYIPAPTKVTGPGASMSAMTVRPPGDHPAAAKPAGGAAATPGAGAPQVTQKSQTLPVMIAQSRNDLADKARAKQSGRRVSAGAGKLAGQKAKRELTGGNSAKAALKNLASKSTHRSSHSNAKSAHHHRAPAASRVAHSQSTGAHAHPGSPHA